MTPQPILLIIALLLGIATLSGQCYQDRHSSAKSASWLSCEETVSPNTIRGEGHWINYDLGEVRKLSKMYFWNLNHPEQLDNGASIVFVDYSLDGQSWTEWGYYEFDRATGAGIYEGQVGPDFEGLETRYLLFTIGANHGGDCYGFSELKIEFSDPVSTTEPSLLSTMDVFPNPAIDQATLKVTSEISTSSATLAIINATGQLLRSEPAQISVGDNIIPLDLEGLSSGIYLVRLSSPQFDQSIELNVTSN